MPVLRVPKHEAPPGAIFLSENEVFIRQKTSVDSHQPKSEVIFLKYGGFMLGCCTVASGFLILRHYRKVFCLRHEGRFSSYLPTSAIPALGSQLGHNLYVTRKILIEDVDCPVCLEMTSASIQMVSGVVWPLFLAPFASSMFAVSNKTFNIPYIKTHPMAYLKLIVKVSKPAFSLFAGITAFQLAAACCVTFFEGKDYHNFRMRCIVKDQLSNET